jgi:hypothetical protein
MSSKTVVKLLLDALEVDLEVRGAVIGLALAIDPVRLAKALVAWLGAVVLDGVRIRWLVLAFSILSETVVRLLIGVLALFLFLVVRRLHFSPVGWCWHGDPETLRLVECHLDGLVIGELLVKDGIRELLDLRAVLLLRWPETADGTLDAGFFGRQPCRGLARTVERVRGAGVVVLAVLDVPLGRHLRTGLAVHGLTCGADQHRRVWATSVGRLPERGQGPIRDMLEVRGDQVEADDLLSVVGR